MAIYVITHNEQWVPFLEKNLVCVFGSIFSGKTNEAEQKLGFQALWTLVSVMLCLFISLCVCVLNLLFSILCFSSMADDNYVLEFSNMLH